MAYIIESTVLQLNKYINDNVEAIRANILAIHEFEEKQEKNDTIVIVASTDLKSYIPIYFVTPLNDK